MLASKQFPHCLYCLWRNFLTLLKLVNFAAILPFILAGVIAWHQAGLMAIGALIGGYASAKFAYKIDPELVRRFVIFVCFSMSLYFFLR